MYKGLFLKRTDIDRIINIPVASVSEPLRSKYHLFGKLLFTWLSLVMSMMVSFVLSFFPRDVLDEILKLIESVSEDFPSYSSLIHMQQG